MNANICGTNVRVLRAKHKMDQVELSAELSVSYDISVSQSDISEIERGVRGVKDFELRALAKVFGVSMDALVDS